MDFKDLFTSRNIIIFIIVLILIVAIFYYTRSRNGLEKFTNSTDDTTGKNATPTVANGSSPFNTQQTTGLDKPDPSAPIVDRTATNPNDLLPNTASANWGNLYPVQNTDGVYVPSMINPAFSVGINSISGTTKNISYDIRSTPIIPKQVVSPFLNSSWPEQISKIGLDPSPSLIA